jgi:hypothetical protein
MSARPVWNSLQLFLTSCNLLTPLPVKPEPHYEMRGTVSGVVAHQHSNDWLLRNLLHGTPTTSAISNPLPPPKKDTNVAGLGFPNSYLLSMPLTPIRKNIKIYEIFWRYTIQFKINSWTLTLYAILKIRFVIKY